MPDAMQDAMRNALQGASVSRMRNAMQRRGEERRGLRGEGCASRGDMTLPYTREKGRKPTVDGLYTYRPSAPRAVSWADQAACIEVDPELFFPTMGRGDMTTAAKDVCSRCRVKRQCLDYALADPTLEGVWGGTTQQERGRMRAGKATA